MNYSEVTHQAVIRLFNARGMVMTDLDMRRRSRWCRVFGWRHLMRLEMESKTLLQESELINALREKSHALQNNLKNAQQSVEFWKSETRTLQSFIKRVLKDDEHVEAEREQAVVRLRSGEQADSDSVVPGHTQDGEDEAKP